MSSKTFPWKYPRHAAQKSKDNYFIVAEIYGPWGLISNLVLEGLKRIVEVGAPVEVRVLDAALHVRRGLCRGLVDGKAVSVEGGEMIMVEVNERAEKTGVTSK